MAAIIALIAISRDAIFNVLEALPQAVYHMRHKLSTGSLDLRASGALLLPPLGGLTRDVSLVIVPDLSQRPCRPACCEEASPPPPRPWQASGLGVVMMKNRKVREIREIWARFGRGLARKIREIWARFGREHAKSRNEIWAVRARKTDSSQTMIFGTPADHARPQTLPF